MFMPGLLKIALFCNLGLTEGPDPRTVAAAYSCVLQKAYREFVLQKAYKEYTGLKVSGKSATLQPAGSEITIHIPDDVHGVILAHAHTDFTGFQDSVPGLECLISPVAEAEYIPRDKNEKEKTYTIQIPHCIENKDDWVKVKVRRGNIRRFTNILSLTILDLNLNGLCFFY